MRLRPTLCGLMALLASAACAQWTQSEQRALDDALFLGNLAREDLKFPRLAKAWNVPALARDAARESYESVDNWLSRLAKPVGTPSSTFELITRAVYEDAAVNIDQPNTPKAPADARLPESLRPSIDRLIAAVARSNSAIKKALEPIPSEQRRPLIESLPQLAAPGQTFDFAKNPPLAPAVTRELAAKIDLRLLRAATRDLMATIETELPILRANASIPLPEPIRWNIGGLIVEIAGNGDDTHTSRDTGLLIDLGGRDQYNGRVAAGIGYSSVLIDLAGNDTFEGPDANLGCGLLGIGVAYDLGGHDIFRTKGVSCGVGVGGVGVLAREGGDDTYRTGALSLGAGVAGIGLCLDSAGDDRYDSRGAAQGFGYLAGLGTLADLAGGDGYRASGAKVQGFGQEGVGVLWDKRGDDTYEATGNAQAVGTDGGLGIVLDEAGADSYRAESRAQSFASAGGSAWLLELGGSDTYIVKGFSGLGTSERGGTAVLLEREGDDLYSSNQSQIATSIDSSLSLVLEIEGDDTYACPISPGLLGSVSLFADAGGTDRRTGDDSGQRTWILNEETVSYDAFDGKAAIDLGSRPRPTAGSVPEPDAAEWPRILDGARSQSPTDRAAAIDRLFGIGDSALVRWLETNLAEPRDEQLAAEMVNALGSQGGDLLLRALQKAEGEAARTLLRVAIRAKSQECLPQVVVRLGQSATSREAAHLAGVLKATACKPELEILAGSPDAFASREALFALDAIGDESTAVTFQVFLESPDPIRRRLAVRFLGRLTAKGTEIGRQMIRSGNERRVRNGIDLLGRVGGQDALSLIAEQLTGTPGVKISALVALNGQVPETSRKAVMDLRRDPNDLVRMVAQSIEIKR